MSQRNQPCPCGSGKRFKHCCGALGANAQAAPPPPTDPADSPFDDGGKLLEPYRRDAMRSRCESLPTGRIDGSEESPPGLLVLQDHLDEETCDRWHGWLSAQTTRPATVKDRDPETGKAVYRLDPQRVTQYVDQGDLGQEIRDRLVASYRDTITPFFGQKLDWMEPPAVLKYQPGGKYDAHADSEYWDPPNRRWVRSIDRDLSLLIYLNDDYEGGSLYLPNFDVRIQPTRGMLIAFPSDHRFMHAAEPLVSGERFAVVCWATVKGSPRVTSTPMQAIWP